MSERALSHLQFQNQDSNDAYQAAISEASSLPWPIDSTHDAFRAACTVEINDAQGMRAVISVAEQPRRTDCILLKKPPISKSRGLLFMRLMRKTARKRAFAIQPICLAHLDLEMWAQIRTARDCACLKQRSRSMNVGFVRPAFNMCGERFARDRPQKTDLGQ